MHTTSTSRAPMPLAAGMLATTLVLAAAACSKTDSAATTGTAAPAASGAPTTTAAAAGGGTGTTAKGGTTGTTAAAASGGGGSCPDKTEITVHTSNGDKTFSTKAGKVAVTLGHTANVSIGSFEVPDDKVGSIAPPKVTGDQLYVTFYLSATKGNLEAGTYKSSADELGPLQLNTSEAYDKDGKVYFTGFSSLKETATVTVVDKAQKKVCGTIKTQTFDGSFSADVISWS